MAHSHGVFIFPQLVLRPAGIDIAAPFVKSGFS
jgi:hypothetical protein